MKAQTVGRFAQQRNRHTGDVLACPCFRAPRGNAFAWPLRGMCATGVSPVGGDERRWLLMGCKRPEGWGLQVLQASPFRRLACVAVAKL